MDFTREPIIETIITPKEGYKLVVRTSKGTAQEEYFVDAVEVVSFGHAHFFRSLERPKSFLVPVSDYEILEVREPRMVLKNAGLDRSIKIGGGREGTVKAAKEDKELEEAVHKTELAASEGEGKPEIKVDKKRDRRKNYRKRRGAKGEEKEEGKEEQPPLDIPPLEDDKINIPPPEEGKEGEPITPISSGLLSSLLQPPPQLISETINRYRENAMFKSAFFLAEEDDYKPHDKVQDLLHDDEDDFAPPLQEPTFVSEEGSAKEESQDTQQTSGEPNLLIEEHEIEASPVETLTENIEFFVEEKQEKAPQSSDQL